MKQYRTTLKMVAITAIIASQITFPSSAIAYDCWAEKKPADYLRNADLVFSGTVTAIATPQNTTGELGTQRQDITFTPNKVWKGITSSKIKSITLQTESLYQYSFQDDETYLVIGYYIQGRDYPTIIGCPRVKPLHTVLQYDIKRLGKPRIDFSTIKSTTSKSNKNRKKISPTSIITDEQAANSIVDIIKNDSLTKTPIAPIFANIPPPPPTSGDITPIAAGTYNKPQITLQELEAITPPPPPFAADAQLTTSKAPDAQKSAPQINTPSISQKNTEEIKSKNLSDTTSTPEMIDIDEPTWEEEEVIWEEK